MEENTAIHANDFAQFDEIATMPVVLGTIAGRYALQQELGAGGMGSVFSAIDLVTQDTVAVKIMQDSRSSTRIERFVREARVTLSLRHPNIVRLLDFGSGDNHDYFQVLELLVGETLAERMKRAEPFRAEEIVAIIGPVLEALEEAHRHGLVHRDLKPENIFLAREGERVIPKLIDFGMARDLEAERAITQAGMVLGTPLYMAPEQIRGESAGPATDLWALGVVVYQLVCRRHPFDARRLAQLYEKQRHGATGFPADHVLDRFVRSCLSFEPTERLSALQHFPV